MAEGKGAGHQPRYYEVWDQRILGDKNLIEQIDARIRIDREIKSPGPRAKPGSPVTLLTTGLAERRGPHQGLTRIRPTIRMSLMRVVDLKIVQQTRFKVLGRADIAALEKATG